MQLHPHLSRLMTKPTEWHVRPAKTQINLGICSVWSESSLSARRKFGSLATHWAHSEDSDQTGTPRLIWVFAERICHLAGFVMRRLIWIKWVSYLLKTKHRQGKKKTNCKKDLAQTYKKGVSCLSNEKSRWHLYTCQSFSHITAVSGFNRELHIYTASPKYHALNPVTISWHWQIST